MLSSVQVTFMNKSTVHITVWSFSPTEYLVTNILYALTLFLTVSVLFLLLQGNTSGWEFYKEKIFLELTAAGSRAWHCASCDSDEKCMLHNGWGACVRGTDTWVNFLFCDNLLMRKLKFLWDTLTLPFWRQWSNGLPAPSWFPLLKMQLPVSQDSRSQASSTGTFGEKTHTISKPQYWLTAFQTLSIKILLTTDFLI
jgi:hypothetical protein